nr:MULTISPECIES: 16S rRNA (cytidine(1402)-2'-O)-methyltransferase [unclassified Ruminococcus]
MSVLYVVGTPIGNLGDMSPRAVETLSSVDFIAAEDTRVTLKLLNHFNIKKPLISYFEHNKAERGEIICQKILSGQSCALVTDAGMPAISDPGEELVRQCREKGIKTVAVPGPSAVVSALALSSLPTGRFTFEGFLSMNKKSRREHLEEIKDERRTMVFYEAPHKLPSTLNDLYNALGDREISIVRELTKLHEEVIHTTLKAAVEKYGDGGIRGEIVLVIKGAEKKQEENLTLEQAVALAADLCNNDGCSLSDACKRAAKETGFKKGEIYKTLLSRKDG